MVYITIPPLVTLFVSYVFCCVNVPTIYYHCFPLLYNILYFYFHLFLYIFMVTCFARHSIFCDDGVTLQHVF